MLPSVRIYGYTPAGEDVVGRSHFPQPEKVNRTPESPPAGIVDNAYDKHYPGLLSSTVVRAPLEREGRTPEPNRDRGVTRTCYTS